MTCLMMIVHVVMETIMDTTRKKNVQVATKQANQQISTNHIHLIQIMSESLLSFAYNVEVLKYAENKKNDGRH